MNLLLIKVFEIILGMIMIFNIAQGLEKNYYLLGIYNIYLSFFLLTGSLGIENILVRNKMSWNKNKENKSNYYMNISLISKKYISFIPCFFLLVLTFYYFEYKYGRDLKVLILLLVFIYSSYINLLMNSYELFYIAENNFYKIFISRLFLDIFFKFVLSFFIKELGYFNFLLSYSLIINIRFLYLKLGIKIEKLDIKFNEVLTEVKKVKYYIKENYLRFLFKTGDQVLATLFLNKSYLSTYSLIKNIENIGLTFIDSFFDPLLQKEIKNKNNLKKLNINLKKMMKISYLIVFFEVTIMGIYMKYRVLILQLLNFQKYEEFYLMSLIIGICLVIYTILKIDTSIIYLFFEPKYRVHLIGSSSLSLIFVFFLKENNFIYIRLISYILTFICIKIILYKNGGELNEKNIYNDV